jgi:hypothetical protein
MIKPPPKFWLTCDPGDVHVGVASWEHVRCVAAWEDSPNVFVDRLADDWIPAGLDLLVIETFSLYAWQAAEQSGSQFLTPQLIGAAKHLCRRANVSVIQQQASVGKAVYKAERLNSRLVKWRGHGRHAKDAEAHGIAYIAKWERQMGGYE